MTEADLPANRVMGVALNVTDLDASKAFYEGVLGMTHASTLPVPGQGREYVMTMSGALSASEPMVVLAALGEGPEPGNDSFGRVVITTRDAEGIAEKARARGFDTVRYPMPDGIDVIVYFVRDPDGYRIEIVQDASRPAASAPGS